MTSLSLKCICCESQRRLNYPIREECYLLLKNPKFSMLKRCFRKAVESQLSMEHSGKIGRLEGHVVQNKLFKNHSCTQANLFKKRHFSQMQLTAWLLVFL